MTNHLIGGVNAAFIGVNDLDESLALFVDELGWTQASAGVLAQHESSALWGPGVGELAYVELRAAGAAHGRVILLRVPDQETPSHPMQSDLGLVAINMYTQDLDVSHQRLTAAGTRFRTPPASWSVPLGETIVTVTQAFVLAPDGLDVVLVQPGSARGTAAWDADPSRHYTEMTSVVCHVPDFEAEADFWGPDGLGLQQWYDVTFSDPGLDAMAQLPAGSRMRLAFFAGETTARLEVTELQDRTTGDDRRAVQRTGLHRGHTGWLFHVHELAATLAAVSRLGGEVLAQTPTGPTGLFGGAPVAYANTPNGLPVTFVERRG